MWNGRDLIKDEGHCSGGSPRQPRTQTTSTRVPHKKAETSKFKNYPARQINWFDSDNSQPKLIRTRGWKCLDLTPNYGHHSTQTSPCSAIPTAQTQTVTSPRSAMPTAQTQTVKRIKCPPEFPLEKNNEEPCTNASFEETTDTLSFAKQNCEQLLNMHHHSQQRNKPETYPCESEKFEDAIPCKDMGKEKLVATENDGTKKQRCSPKIRCSTLNIPTIVNATPLSKMRDNECQTCASMNSDISSERSRHRIGWKDYKSSESYTPRGQRTWLTNIEFPPTPDPRLNTSFSQSVCSEEVVTSPTKVPPMQSDCIAVLISNTRNENLSKVHKQSKQPTVTGLPRNTKCSEQMNTQQLHECENKATMSCRQVINSKEIEKTLQQEIFSNIVLDGYNPGIIQDTVDEKANFNDMVLAIVHNEKVQSAGLPPLLEPPSMLEVFLKRIQYERSQLKAHMGTTVFDPEENPNDLTGKRIKEGVKDYFSQDHYHTPLNEAISGLLTAELLHDHRKGPSRTQPPNIDVIQRIDAKFPETNPVQMFSYSGVTRPKKYGIKIRDPSVQN